MTVFYAAAHALIDNGGRYLVTRRSAVNDYMPLKWDIPGGTVDAGESLEEALIREVSEETGVTIEVERVLYAYTNLGSLPERQVFQVVFLCRYAGGEVELDPREHDQYLWADRAEMEQLDALAFLDGLRNSRPFQALEPRRAPHPNG